MPRSLLLVAALVLAALPVPAPVTAAPSPAPQPASIEFDLPASNGLRAHVEAFDGEVNLEISNKSQAVSYEVVGESTESGLKAQFGALGAIDVAFAPTETSTSRPPKGCKGDPHANYEGVFAGTIAFTGEREYVRIEASQVEGRMSVTPAWECPRAGQSRSPGSRSLGAFDFRLQPEVEEEPATLRAISRSCRCGFLGLAVRGREGRDISAFSGFRAEGREGMKIGRVTFVEAGISAFSFNHKRGTATVRPPRPFSGHATFKRRPGRDLWRSTIRFPLLGADPQNVSGRKFRAALIRDLPGD